MHKKMFRSSARLLDLANRTTLIISNKEMNDIMKIIDYENYERHLLACKDAIRAGEDTIRAGQDF